MSAAVIDFLPPMPDLGVETAIPDPADPGNYILNIAATIRIVRHEPTPAAAKFYLAFFRHWSQVRFGPGTVDERQATAFQRACDEVGFKRSTGVGR